MKTTVKATVSIEVTHFSSWDTTSRLIQIQEQVKKETLDTIEGIFRNKGGVRVIGEPKITLISIEET